MEAPDEEVKKKLIILAIAAAAVTVVVLITAVLGALSQIISSRKGKAPHIIQALLKIFPGLLQSR